MAPRKTLYGGETKKAVDNFPISGETVPASVIHWLGRIKGAAARANAELGKLDPELADAIAARRRRGGRRRPRRAVPDRRLPDRLGDLVEHERQRGHGRAGRRWRARQRPRQHGPVLQRRVPQRGAPRGAGPGDQPAAARAQAARALVDAQGQALPERRQVGPHAPHGRGAGDARPGVRRLRGAGPPRPGAHRGRARRTSARSRSAAPPRAPASTRTRSSPSASGASSRGRPSSRSRRRPTRSRRRPTATRWSSCPAR